MGSKSGSLDYWRNYFQTANSDIFEVIENAILVAASDYPKKLRIRRDGIAESLYSSRMINCSGCDSVQLTVPEKNEKEKKDEGFKRGLGGNGDAFKGASKESKVNSSITDQLEMDTNRVSNYSYDEAEALTQEIEEESQVIGEVSRIKEILENFQDESDGSLFESLRRLQLMDLSVEILQATEVGKAVNRLQRHMSKQIQNLACILIDGWKQIVDEWVKATAAATTAGEAKTITAESSPDSVKPSIVDNEEEEEEGGLPSPPLDEGVFLTTQTGPMELSRFFDGMDDDGNPRNSGEFNRNQENRRKSVMENRNVLKKVQQPWREENMLTKDNKGQFMKKQETVIKQNKPFKTDSSNVKPLKPSSGQNINKGIKFQQKPNRLEMQKRPMAYPKDKPKFSNEVSVAMKLEASKRKLQQGYQQAENAKKQRTIQVMELRDLPKQGLGHKNPYVRNGNRPQNWANGRR